MLLAAKSLHISRFVQISSYPHPFLTICGLPVPTSKKRHISSSSEPVQNAVIRSVVNCKSISPFSVIVTSVTVSSVSKCRIRSNFLSNTQESCTPKSTAPLDGDAFLYKSSLPVKHLPSIAIRNGQSKWSAYEATSRSYPRLFFSETVLQIQNRSVRSFLQYIAVSLPPMLSEGDSLSVQSP